MTTNATTEARLRPRFRRASPASQKKQHAPERQHSLVVWITLIGIFLPQVLIPLGFINLTPGRFTVMLLFIPALATLLKAGRHRVTSDLFAVALAAWMLGSSYLNGGFTRYVGAEALEFLGPYLVGRAFIFGPTNLRTFIKALRRITVVLVAVALLDTLSGRNITLDTFGMPHGAVVRLGLVRAASVFEGAEHFGMFCAAVAAIFFYSERNIARILYVSLSSIGCVLALSSGPLMGLGLVTATFSYDRILKQYRWRWKALMTTVVGFLLIIYFFFDHPTEWILVHLTLDPQTGFFRIATWNAAVPLIGQAPFIGHGVAGYGQSLTELGGSIDPQYLSSVDCVWLVEAIRYGVPGVILLILTMLFSLRRPRMHTFNPSIDDLPTGFSLAVVTIGLIGITVHFWDATWLFLNLCVGIRASLAEYELNRNRVRSNDLHFTNLATSPT